MHLRDVAYFQARAAAERRLAEAANCPEAAAAHEELASHYERLVAQEGERPTLSIVSPNPVT